jgi:hypothetical protein
MTRSLCRQWRWRDLSGHRSFLHAGLAKSQANSDPDEAYSMQSADAGGNGRGFNSVCLTTGFLRGTMNRTASVWADYAGWAPRRMIFSLYRCGLARRGILVCVWEVIEEVDLIMRMTRDLPRPRRMTGTGTRATLFEEASDPMVLDQRIKLATEACHMLQQSAEVQGLCEGADQHVAR